MEFNSQICTTKEQSERLLALGLKKETSDMYYPNGVQDSEHLIRAIYPAFWDSDRKIDALIRGRVTPAWSLHRLIEMADTYIEFSPFTGVTFQDGAFSTNRDNDYDAIVDIIEKKKKKDHFNKEYLEE